MIGTSHVWIGFPGKKVDDRNGRESREGSFRASIECPLPFVLQVQLPPNVTIRR